MPPYISRMRAVSSALYSAYLYLDMANFYSSKGLDGFANWYEIQAKEEQDHAMLIYKYLHNNDQTVTLGAIAKPEGPRLWQFCG